MKQWELAKNREAFNYNLSVQLNVERGTLRRKPSRFNSINEPFNNLKWNFTRLKNGEFLFLLKCLDRPYTEDKLDIHMVAVNSSPIERGNCLVIPCLNKCMPQVLSKTAIRIATDLMLLIEEDHFFVLFNSLLGCASVNHLHLHTLFWPYESGITSKNYLNLADDLPNVFVIRRPEWFAHCFVLQLHSHGGIEEFISNIVSIVEFLNDQNIAHNILMARAPKKSFEFNGLFVTTYIFPRQNNTGLKPFSDFNAASAELAGFIPVYSWKVFEGITENKILRTLAEDTIFPDCYFNELAEKLANFLRRVTESDIKTELIHVSTSGISDSDVLTQVELDELSDIFYDPIALPFSNWIP